MEICRHNEYREAVEKFKFFLPGTLHLLHNRKVREEVPENCCIIWKKTTTSLKERRFIKPEVTCIEPPAPTEETSSTESKTVESKWIPVLPGLISQRLVNENKTTNMLLLG